MSGEGVPRQAPHQAPQQWPFWQVQTVGWVSFYLYDLFGALPSLVHGKVTVLDETIPIAFMFLGSCVMHPICRRLRRRSLSWTARELQAALSCAAVSLVAGLCAGVVSDGPRHMDWTGIWTLAMWTTFILFMWSSLYFSIMQWRQSIDERERLLRAESEVQEARLLALRYQLNPHFLFNSLNAVSTLVLDGKSTAATRMLAQIGGLLRTSLESEVATEVTLARELAFTEDYLAIEQTRLGDRLRVQLNIAADSLDAMVPSLLLQPLVENAVRYGVAPVVEGGWISIESACSGSALHLAIKNSGRRDVDLAQPHGSGIGLGNTIERLKTLYGTEFDFALTRDETGGCEVTLQLPLRMTPSSRQVAVCAL